MPQLINNHYKPDEHELPYVVGFMNAHGFRTGGDYFHKIQAIKDVRTYFGTGLREAKDMVDWAGNNVRNPGDYRELDCAGRGAIHGAPPIGMADPVKEKMRHYLVMAREILEEEFGETQDFVAVQFAQAIMEYCDHPRLMG